MSKKMNIEELVRSKLDQAEVTPSAGAWKGVQRKLRMKRFLRFDPGSFNIYYLGAVLVAGAALVAITGREDTVVPTGTGPAETVIRSEEPGSAEAISPRPVPGEKPEVHRLTRPVEEKITGAGGKMEAGETREEPEKVPAGPSQSLNSATPEEAVRAETLPEPAGQVIPVSCFTASVTEGCAPLQVQFLNNSLNAVAFSWTFGTGDISTEADPDYRFSDPGKYTVVLHAVNKAGTSQVYRRVIEVRPAPEAGFEISEGIPGVDGTRTLELMNYSTGASAWSWELLDGDGDRQGDWTSRAFQPVIPVNDLDRATRYVQLVATTEQGCADTAREELPAHVAGEALELRFPTAFEASHTGPTGGTYSPNEHRSDLFHPRFSEVPAEYHLQVFSRMGELVFESREIFRGWDGYVQQERAAGGVYLWVAEGTWENGTSFSYRGDVTLLWSDRRWP
jgi:hypothetical protein